MDSLQVKVPLPDVRSVESLSPPEAMKRLNEVEAIVGLGALVPQQLLLRR
jgi:hypothetical protein